MIPSDQLAHQILTILPLINRIMAAELRQEVGEDVSMAQFRVMTHLRTPHTLSEIARKRRVSLQSAGGLVQALVERGWVLRETDPRDRRQTILTLSEIGQQQFERVYARMQQQLLPYIDQLEQHEIDAVSSALQALERIFSGSDEIEAITNDEP